MDMLVLSGNGRLTRDPEWKQTANSEFMVFTVAAENGFGDNKNTTYLECIYFGKAANAVFQYLHKGSPISFSGEFSAKKWESANGKGMNLSCRIYGLALLPNPNRDSQESDRGDHQEGGTQRSTQRRDFPPAERRPGGESMFSGLERPQGGLPQRGPQGGGEGFTDDIPF